MIIHEKKRNKKNIFIDNKDNNGINAKIKKWELTKWPKSNNSIMY